MSKTSKVLALIAAVALAAAGVLFALMVTGCSGNDKGSGLTNSATEAWTECTPWLFGGEMCYGVSLRSNKDIIIVNKVGDGWTGCNVGAKWAVSGNEFTLSIGGMEIETGTYDLSGNTLTAYFEGEEEWPYILTRTKTGKLNMTDCNLSDILWKKPEAAKK